MVRRVLTSIVEILYINSLSAIRYFKMLKTNLDTDAIIAILWWYVVDNDRFKIFNLKCKTGMSIKYAYHDTTSMNRKDLKNYLKK